MGSCCGVPEQPSYAMGRHQTTLPRRPSGATSSRPSRPRLLCSCAGGGATAGGLCSVVGRCRAWGISSRCSGEPLRAVVPLADRIHMASERRRSRRGQSRRDLLPGLVPPPLAGALTDQKGRPVGLSSADAASRDPRGCCGERRRNS
ncbi:hypothetical protein SEVIR_2G414400v4 [Setaria viridis]|uniref:Uncharacterized protein n=2 Tax=Setaria TaxID=4554 RepID=A0A368Q832_SETIT|nr:hypothetical protein SETIT_2G402600v2 [Setaria italica]TKW36043.1 hypothetical protein SEVIR_2G414400v2 [Setaria viridis]